MRGKHISGYLKDKKLTPAWIILLVMMVLFNCTLTLAFDEFSDRNNWVIIKCTTADTTLITQLERLNLTLLYQITPLTYIFDGQRDAHDVVTEVRKLYPDTVLEAEPVRIYNDTLKPWQRNINMTSEDYTDSDKTITGYSHGIVQAWANGYSGQDVTVAVTGAGIDSELPDLNFNFNSTLSFNFVTNTADVTPEQFTQNETKHSTNHGNSIATVIAAKENNVCPTGIAYNSSIVGTKLFALNENEATPGRIMYWTTSDILARAVIHHLDDIDIFVNPWSTLSPFDYLDLATREAFIYGATEGRRGLGTVHILPAGAPGNWLSNNIYTLTVGTTGDTGVTPGGAVYDASVITSGLSEGIHLNSSKSDDTCRTLTGFRGYSRAIAYVSGIIALGLQANPHLSLRDIQHLLVLASSHTALEQRAEFTPNAAGHYYHTRLGFGLLDADKFTSMALTITTPPLISQTFKSAGFREVDAYTLEYEFFHVCGITSGSSCLATVEHVVVAITSMSGILKIEVISPKGTRSILIDHTQNTVNANGRKRIELVSVNFWNEVAHGVWTVLIYTRQQSEHIDSPSVDLTLYGTRDETSHSNRAFEIHKLSETFLSGRLTSPPPDVRNISTTTSPPPDKDSTLSIPLLVVLPVGVVIGCVLLGYILMRGNGHMPISSEKIKKRKPTSTRRKRYDSPLHQQIAMLRQQSRQESTSEDVEGEAV